MKTYKKMICAALTLAMTFSLPAAGAFAGPASAKSDETMYINLDYYGNVSNASVVKAYELNGSKEVTDYGKYTQINNMSNLTQPETDGEKVTFKLDEDTKRFYFEGQLEKNTVELPWNIDVGYKLNGVETNGDELAGKSGLVEININVLPNPKTSEYFKNNMILQIATGVSMDDVLSVEAEGSQMQTVGNLKAIVFMALPAEEQHFTIRIGSEDFSFAGLYFLMIPGTLAQIEDIRNLKEAKEKVEDSADAINESLDIILETMSSLQGGLSETSDGLRKLDEARRIISSSKQEVYDKADISLESLKALSEKAQPFVGHINEAKAALTDTNSQLNETTNDLMELSPLIYDAKEDLENISESLKVIKEVIVHMEDNSQRRQDTGEQAMDDLDDLRKTMEHLEILLRSTGNLATSLPSVSGGLSDFPSTGDPSTDALIGMLNSKIAEVNGLMGALSSTGTSAVWQGGSILSVLGVLSDESLPLIDDMNSVISHLDEYMTILEDNSSELKEGIDSSRDLLKTVDDALSVTDDLIDDITKLTDIANKYHPDAVKALEDASALTDEAVKGIDNMQSFLSTAENVAKTSGVSLDDGTRGLLLGLINSINVSVDGLAQTGTIKDAKQTIYDTINDEWDKYSQEDMTFLNMDETSEKVSFTSAKNPSPESLQIVLRTQEITSDDEEDDNEVDESFHAQGNFFTRVIDIFKRIINLVKGIFGKN